MPKLKCNSGWNTQIYLRNNITFAILKLRVAQSVEPEVSDRFPAILEILAKLAYFFKSEKFGILKKSRRKIGENEK